MPSPYSSLADVRKHCPEFEDSDFDALIERTISEADSEIDSKLSQRYTVPFAAPTPARIRDLSAMLAAHKAKDDQAPNNETSKVSAALLQDFEDGIRALQTGKESIPGLSVSLRFYATPAVEPALDPLSEENWCW